MKHDAVAIATARFHVAIEGHPIECPGLKQKTGSTAARNRTTVYRAAIQRPRTGGGIESEGLATVFKCARKIDGATATVEYSKRGHTERPGEVHHFIADGDRSGIGPIASQPQSAAAH